MIRALLATATVATIGAVGHRLYRSGKLDGALGRVGSQLLPFRPPALEKAYAGANASRPAPAHPWPIDPQSLGKNAPGPDAG
jgi:hypothetical protein